MAFSRSSSSCLRKIKEAFENANISEKRIRKTCLQCNFDIEKSIAKLSKEEAFKKTLLVALKEKINFEPSSETTNNCCEIFKYDEQKCLTYLTNLASKKFNQQREAALLVSLETAITSK
jgi:hypothetical protein